MEEHARAGAYAKHIGIRNWLVVAAYITVFKNAQQQSPFNNLIQKTKFAIQSDFMIAREEWIVIKILHC